jgi:DNA-binding GntR family transcriptional regulator
MTSARAQKIVGPIAPPTSCLEAVKRATLKDQSYSGLRRALISGRFEPGAQVTIKHLADQLGAGLMPVREAVQRLVAEGALAALPTGRVYVPRLTRQAFEEIVELRLMLEPLAAAKAAVRADAELPDRLAAVQEEMDMAVDAGDSEGVLWANYRFHFGIYSEAGSGVLEEHIESLWLRAGPMIVHLFGDPERRARFKSDGVGLHEDILKPLRRHDPKAASRTMTRIISTAADWYRESFPFADIG